MQVAPDGGGGRPTSPPPTVEGRDSPGVPVRRGTRSPGYPSAGVPARRATRPQPGVPAVGHRPGVPPPGHPSPTGGARRRPPTRVPLRRDTRPPDYPPAGYPGRRTTGYPARPRHDPRYRRHPDDGFSGTPTTVAPGVADPHFFWTAGQSEQREGYRCSGPPGCSITRAVASPNWMVRPRVSFVSLRRLLVLAALALLRSPLRGSRVFSARSAGPAGAFGP